MAYILLEIAIGIYQFHPFVVNVVATRVVPDAGIVNNFLTVFHGFVSMKELSEYLQILGVLLFALVSAEDI